MHAPLTAGAMRIVVEGAMPPPELRGGALAIGNFDGVHRGHQAVIGDAVERARRLDRPAIIVTFDPHPSRLFRPDTPPFALSTIDQRLEWCAALGVSGAMVVPFTRELAGLSAEKFVADWLAARLAPEHVVTGHDFSFGRGRSGNPDVLARLGAAHGFSTRAVPPVTDCGAPASSTRVREALVAGDLAEATRLLTRPFTIRGAVIHGDKRGRTIGAPTANMELGAYLRPRFGVYAARVRLPSGQRVSGVANLGIRPMFEPPKLLLETWIFDWEGDLYDQVLDVELVAFLRDEMQLDGLDALRVQIARDAEAARRALC
ncbi:MAG: bifunctional riboflavin kinase/FAD synthetase [Thermaurantiacus sp.]